MGSEDVCEQRTHEQKDHVHRRRVASPLTLMWMPPETTKSEPITAMKLTYSCAMQNTRAGVQSEQIVGRGDRTEAEGDFGIMFQPPPARQQRASAIVPSKTANGRIIKDSGQWSRDPCCHCAWEQIFRSTNSALAASEE